MGKFEVLRIGHRPERDKRITTHVALTSRAFGASKMYLSKKDSRVVKSIDNVVTKFGGDFSVKVVSNPKKIVKNWEGKIVHLTMFGLPFQDYMEDLRSQRDNLLFIVGAEKVPPWAFELSDYNLSVGNQPHSEISALAVVLAGFNPSFSDIDFDGDLKVVPSLDYRQMVSKT